MDAERDEDLLVVATASLGFLVMATCHEINRKHHHGRKTWVKSWIGNRALNGTHSTLFHATTLVIVIQICICECHNYLVHLSIIYFQVALFLFISLFKIAYMNSEKTF